MGVYHDEENLTVKIVDMKFSGEDNDRHIQSLRLFEKFCRGVSLRHEELLSIIPTKTECRQILRYLMSFPTPQSLSFSVIVRRLGGDMTCAKLRVALEAFDDLGIITLCEDIHKIEIKSLDISEKVNLEDAKIFKKLGEVYRNGQV